MADTVWKQLSDGMVRVLQSSGLQLGPIHDRPRLVDDYKSFFAQLTSLIDGQRQMRGWEVVRERMSAEWHTFGKNLLRTYHFALTGYVGFNDREASELAAQDVADRLCDYLDDQPDLDISLSNASQFLIGPTQIRDIDTVRYGNVVCHRIEIEVPVQVLVAI